MVIPARNEESTIAGCLRSVDRAVWRLALLRPDVVAEVLVVLDSCTDRTASVVAGFPHVRVLPVAHGRVGASRAAGVDSATAGLAADTTDTTAAAASTWVANTDADSEVPVDWLTSQLAHADTGAHAVLGTVEPRGGPAGPRDGWGEGLAAEVLARWHARHVLAEGHPHVHGANLGVRLDWYRAAGGFEPVPVHEDVELVRRLSRAGARLARSGSARVVTSARLVGRTPGGFAGYLSELETGRRAG